MLVVFYAFEITHFYKCYVKMWRSSRSFHKQPRVQFYTELLLSRSNPYPYLYTRSKRSRVLLTTLFYRDYRRRSKEEKA
jgi:hypothetical protein